MAFICVLVTEYGIELKDICSTRALVTNGKLKVIIIVGMV
jgi:hypothetical protein